MLAMVASREGLLVADAGGARESARVAAAGGADLARLIEEHLPAIYRFHFRLCRNVQEAEDRTQSTFLKAVRGFATFRPGTNFRAWVYRIAANVATDAGTAQGRQRKESLHDVAEPAAPRGPDPTVSAELRRAIDDGVAALPPDLATVLVFKLIEGLAHSEIAGMLEVTEETVRWRLWKARTLLRERLAPHLS
jgi:RNA polymerase sigma-70 factor (ECF subfamily)